ncbi:YveK family protein [Streptomyces megasporus]|uniref:YveK family protein n=1 Tax=Streptomyces megasporus TaxID=44060 RepID=UPI001B809D4F|nr:lipopolysaccharide biosynthesis protein [Streptomyces megasporus]
MTTSRTTRTTTPSGRPGRLDRLRSWRPWRGSTLPAWAPPALGALLGVTGGAAYGLLATPEYTATSYVVVVPGAGSDSATALGFAQAYGRVATDSAVLSGARAAAGMSVDALRDSVRSVTSPDAPMVEITGTASSPDRAAAVSNAVADALTKSGNLATGNTGVQLSLFSPAFEPTEPTSPSAPLSAAVGLCAGGLVGSLVRLAAPRGRREPEIPQSPGVPAPANGDDRDAKSATVTPPVKPASVKPTPAATSSATATATAPAPAAVGTPSAPAPAGKPQGERRRRNRRSVR